MHARTAEPISVLLVTGERVAGNSLRAMVDDQPDLVVVAQATTIDDAIRAEVRPQVVVTDGDLGGRPGPDVLRALRAGLAPAAIVVVSASAHPPDVEALLRTGADGYLVHPAEPAELAHAIRSVATGRTYLQPSVGVDLARWHGASDDTPRVPASGLSPDEREVLRLLALGYTNGEIARSCGVSLSTVETRRDQILVKLGRRSRPSAPLPEQRETLH